MRIHLSISDLGVQIVTDNVAEGLRKSYLPGDPLWPDLFRLANRDFKHLPQIKGHKLCRVDIREHDTQWSFKPI